MVNARTHVISVFNVFAAHWRAVFWFSGVAVCSCDSLSKYGSWFTDMLTAVITPVTELVSTSHLCQWRAATFQLWQCSRCITALRCCKFCTPFRLCYDVSVLCKVRWAPATGCFWEDTILEYRGRHFWMQKWKGSFGRSAVVDRQTGGSQSARTYKEGWNVCCVSAAVSACCWTVSQLVYKHTHTCASLRS